MILWLQTEQLHLDADVLFACTKQRDLFEPLDQHSVCMRRMHLNSAKNTPPAVKHEGVADVSFSATLLQHPMQKKKKNCSAQEEKKPRGSISTNLQ